MVQCSCYGIDCRSDLFVRDAPAIFLIQQVSRYLSDRLQMADVFALQVAYGTLAPVGQPDKTVLGVGQDQVILTLIPSGPGTNQLSAPGAAFRG